MYYKENWEQSKQRFRALWAREIVDRCCIAVTAPRKGKTIYQYEFPPDDAGIRDAHVNPDLVLDRYLKTFETTYYGGEAIPTVPINFGPEAHAGYFGASYRFTPRTVWFDPIINDWEKDVLHFDKNNEFYRMHRRLAEELASRADGRYLVSSSDNDSATDCLAALRGTQNLLMDFYDEPDKVREAQKIILDQWAYTEMEFYTISKECNGGSAQAWLNTWAEGSHTHIQCDLSVMISPRIFDEFVLGELTAMCDVLDYAIYHFDGIEELVHLDSLLSIEKLDMIQWMNCDKQLPSSKYIPELKKIQEAGKGLHLFCQPYEVPIFLENLSSKGLYMVTTADSQEEAEDLIRLTEKMTRE